MKQIGRKLTLALLVLLSFVMMLTGVMTLRTNADAAQADAPAAQQHVEAEWFKLTYDKATFALQLNGNFREYFNSESGSFSKLVNALKDAAQEILVENILGSFKDKTAEDTGTNTVALMPLALGDEELPDPNDPTFWGDEGRLKEFRDYIVDRLSDPAELESYYNGEYDMLLEYAVGTYIEKEGTDGKLTEEQKKDMTKHVESVLAEAQDRAEQNLKDLAESEYMKGEGGVANWDELSDAEKEAKRGALTEEQQKALKDKQDGEVQKFQENVVEPGKQKQGDDFIGGLVQKVEDNGGKPSISLDDIIKALREVKVDGKVLLAKGEDAGGLHFYSETLRYLGKKLHKPSEIEHMTDEELASLLQIRFDIDTTFGTIGFDFSFGFFGGTDAIRNACSFIAKHIDLTVDGEKVTANLLIPEAFTKAFLKMTESEHIPENIKNMVFVLFGKTPRDMLGKVESYEYADLINYLKSIDYQYWFNNFLSANFINSYFGRYLTDILGHELTDADIDSVIDGFTSYAQKLKDKNWTYDDAFSFLKEKVPAIGRLESSVPEAVKDAVNKLLEIVNRIDWSKYDAQYVRDELKNSETLNDSIYSYIEDFKGEDIYNRFIDLIEKLFNALPAKIQDGALLDMYKGDGVFTHAGVYTYNFKDLFTKAANWLGDHGYEKYADAINGFCDRTDDEKTTFTVDLSLRVTAQNVYKVSYYLGTAENGSELLREGLLPAGADINLFGTKEIEGHKILGWIVYGEQYAPDTTEYVETVGKDIQLYPVTQFTLDQFVGEDATGELAITYDGEAHTLKVKPNGVSFAEGYTYQWYKDSEAIEGAAEATLDVTHVDESGDYSVVVYDMTTGIAAEGEYTFAVNIDPAHFTLKQLVDEKKGTEYEAAYDGTAHTLAVELVGTPEGETVTYAWSKDGKTIAGATEAELEVTHVSESGDYTITATPATTDIVVDGEYAFTVAITPAAINLTFAKLQYVVTEGGNSDGEWKAYPSDGITYVVEFTSYQVRLDLTADGVCAIDIPEDLFTVTGNLIEVSTDLPRVAGNYELTYAINAKSASAGDFELKGEGGKVEEYKRAWVIKSIEITELPADTWANKAVEVDFVGTDWIKQEPVKYTGLANYAYGEYFALTYEYTDENQTKVTEAIDPGTYNVKAVLTLQLPYSLGYTVKDHDDGIITFSGATLTIRGAQLKFEGFRWKTADFTYDGEPKEAEYTYTSCTVENVKTLVEIEYWNGTTKLTGAPVDAGTYTLKLVTNAAGKAQGFETVQGVVDGQLIIKKATATATITPATVTKPFGTYQDSDVAGFFTISVKSGDKELAATAYQITHTSGFTNVVEGTAQAGEFTALFEITLGNNYAFADGTSAMMLEGKWTVSENTQSGTIAPGTKFRYPATGDPEVEVTVVEGNIPDDYTASVTPDDLKSYLDDIKALDALKDQKYVGGKAYDIHFNDASGKEAGVNGKFHLRLLIPEDIRGCDHIYVVHIADDGSVQIVDGATQNGNYMECDVDGFSIYAVIGFNDKTLDWLLIAGLVIITVLLLAALIVIAVFTVKLKPEEAAAEETTEETAEEPAEEPEEEPVEETPEEEPEEEPAEEPVAEETAEEVPAEEEPAEEPQEEPVPEEEPAEEPQEEPQEEPAPEEEPAEEEAPAEETPAEVLPIVAAAAETTMTVYDRSFTARLVQAENEAKAYYNEIKNYILSYKYVRSRISWSYDTFNKGRGKICRLQLKGKSLYMYIALDPTTLDPKYHHKDVSAIAKYAAYPTKLKIRSARSLKYAKLLVDMVMAELGLERNEEYEAQDFSLAFKTTDQLIASGEIREKEVPAPDFWSMDANDVVENSPVLPDVELPEEHDETKDEDDED